MGTTDAKVVELQLSLYSPCVYFHCVSRRETLLAFRQQKTCIFHPRGVTFTCIAYSWMGDCFLIVDPDPDSTTTTPPNSDLLTSPCETSLGDDENSCDLLLEDDTFRDSSESVTGDDTASLDKGDSKSRKKSSKSCNSDTKSGTAGTNEYDISHIYLSCNVTCDVPLLRHHGQRFRDFRFRRDMWE
jgi:hypothetical protein